MRLAGIIISLAMLIVDSEARDRAQFAKSTPEMKKWFDDLKSEIGPCCADADGTALSDVDWESKNGHYRVRLNGQWIDVPDDALVTAPNLAGRTMVWPMPQYEFDTIKIRCFLPGPMIEKQGSVSSPHARIPSARCRLLALFRHGAMSDLSPLSGAKRKLDVGAIRAAFDPDRKSPLSRRGPDMLLCMRLKLPSKGLSLTSERVERRLAAVLAADVARYSRLLGANEEGTLSRLKAVRKDLVDPAIASHRGRIVKTTGDGMLVEFSSAVDACVVRTKFSAP